MAITEWRIDSRVAGAVVQLDEERDCWVLVGVDAEGNTVEELGCDGGEPEDQTLVRDWDWVPDLINSLLSDMAALRAELARRDEEEKDLSGLRNKIAKKRSRWRHDFR